MQNVTVARKELLDKIKENAKTHKEEYNAAFVEYRKDAIEKLQAQLDKAQKGEAFLTHIALPTPENHSKDYERVISMLKMSVDETVELDAHAFDQYVLDNWSWKHTFAATNAMYTSKVKSF